MEEKEEVKKIKVMMIGDDPRAPSGVGGQIHYIARALLDSGKFCVRNLAGSPKHDNKNYSPVRMQEDNDDWVVFPVDDYGDEGLIRSMLRLEKPDILWIMTDPRYYWWLWQFENEIRPLVPLVYYHVWDNYPVPDYNEPWYDSNDLVISISKLTEDCVAQVAQLADQEYIPHAVNEEIFFDMWDDPDFDNDKLEAFKRELLPRAPKDATIFFWNNRNAKRKKVGTLLAAFSDFCERHGDDKAVLLLHTNPDDHHGPNIPSILKSYGLDKGQVVISRDKQPASWMAAVYNIADCTVNIAEAEGYGLSNHESLACGTPIIAVRTGGLQDQITDGEDVFGISLEPAARALIGTQTIPYIFEDHVSIDDLSSAFERMVEMGPAERQKLGAKGREYITTNHGFEDFKRKWVEVMLEAHEKYGSWDTRKRYKRYTLERL